MDEGQSACYILKEVEVLLLSAAFHGCSEYSCTNLHGMFLS